MLLYNQFYERLQAAVKFGDLKLVGRRSLEKPLLLVEEHACRQAINMVQGALASAPAMGLEIVEQGKSAGAERFTIISDLKVRALAELAFKMTFADFFDSLATMFDPDPQVVEEDSEEEDD